MLREKFVTKKQFEVFSRNLDRKLNALKIPSFTVPDDNYEPDDMPGAGLPAGGVDYQVLYADSTGAAQWAMPGTRNVFIGEDAAKNVTVGSRIDNVFLGYLAGYGDGANEFDGDRNVIIGSYDDSIITTTLFGECSDNVFIGYGAGGAAIDSSGNVIIGAGINLYTLEGYTLTNCVLLGMATVFGKTANFTNSIALGYGADILADNTCYIGNDDLELVITQGDIRTEGVYYVVDDQVVGARVIDADFANTPDTGDADTDDLIDKMRTALITHGLMSAS